MWPEHTPPCDYGRPWILMQHSRPGAMPDFCLSLPISSEHAAYRSSSSFSSLGLPFALPLRLWRFAALLALLLSPLLSGTLRRPIPSREPLPGPRSVPGCILIPASLSLPAPAPAPGLTICLFSALALPEMCRLPNHETMRRAPACRHCCCQESTTDYGRPGITWP